MNDQISESAFVDDWEVFTQPSGDMFTFDDVCHAPARHVWTVVESGDDSDGSWYACPGFHVVNQLGYVMTKKPWTDVTHDAIYFLDDLGDEHDTGHCEVDRS